MSNSEIVLKQAKKPSLSILAKSFENAELSQPHSNLMTYMNKNK